MAQSRLLQIEKIIETIFNLFLNYLLMKLIDQ